MVKISLQGFITCMAPENIQVVWRNKTDLSSELGGRAELLYRLRSAQKWNFRQRDLKDGVKEEWISVEIQHHVSRKY
jgi:hypothetical protein